MLGLNPWLILGLVVALGIAIGSAYYRGREDGKAVIIASQARALSEQQAIVAAELREIGTNLAALKPVNRTIIQKVEREIIEKPVFRDCRSGDLSVQQFNAIVEGSPDSTRDGELPKTDPAK